MRRRQCGLISGAGVRNGEHTLPFLARRRAQTDATRRDRLFKPGAIKRAKFTGVRHVGNIDRQGKIKELFTSCGV